MLDVPVGLSILLLVGLRALPVDADESGTLLVGGVDEPVAMLDRGGHGGGDFTGGGLPGA